MGSFICRYLPNLKTDPCTVTRKFGSLRGFTGTPIGTYLQGVRLLPLNSPEEDSNAQHLLEGPQSLQKIQFNKSKNPLVSSLAVVWMVTPDNQCNWIS